ncbi:MAG: hypothetical protein AABW59_02140 [archaeon]
MPKTNQPRRPNGTLMGLARRQRAKLLAAAIDSSNISYSQVARQAGVSKSTVIASKLRPKGNLIATRQVKNPLMDARLKERKEVISQFIANETFAKRGISVNDLQKRFGGEKKFLKSVIDYVDELLSSTAGIRVIRRTKSDQSKRQKGSGQYIIKR